LAAILVSLVLVLVGALIDRRLRCAALFLRLEKAQQLVLWAA